MLLAVEKSWTPRGESGMMFLVDGGKGRAMNQPEEGGNVSLS